MGTSADRVWQLSQLVEGVLTACTPSHDSLSCVETNCVSFASVQARKLNHSVCFSFPHEVGYFMGALFMVGHCVSKQIGRHDAACQGCPRCVSRSPVLGTPQSHPALRGPQDGRARNAPWAALAGCITPPNLFGHTMSGLHVRQAAVAGVESSQDSFHEL